MTDSLVLFDKKIRLNPLNLYYGQKPIAANLVLRFLAFLIDSLILIFLICFVEAFLLSFVWQLPFEKSLKNLFCWHFIYWGIPAQIIVYIYYGFFYLNFAATPGKMVFKLKVVETQSMGQIGFFQIFLREVVGKFYSVLSLGWGFLLAFFREDQKAFHDLISGTWVISSVQTSPLSK